MNKTFLPSPTSVLAGLFGLLFTALSFLVQQEDYAFGELIRASSLPAFTTDRVQRRYGATEGRVAVPISDPGTSVDYFVAYRSADKKRLAAGLKVIEAYVR